MNTTLIFFLLINTLLLISVGFATLNLNQRVKKVHSQTKKINLRLEGLEDGVENMEFNLRQIRRKNPAIEILKSILPVCLENIFKGDSIFSSLGNLFSGGGNGSMPQPSPSPFSPCPECPPSHNEPYNDLNPSQPFDLYRYPNSAYPPTSKYPCGLSQTKSSYPKSTAEETMQLDFEKQMMEEVSRKIKDLNTKDFSKNGLPVSFTTYPDLDALKWVGFREGYLPCPCCGNPSEVIEDDFPKMDPETYFEYSYNNGPCPICGNVHDSQEHSKEPAQDQPLGQTNQ